MSGGRDEEARGAGGRGGRGDADAGETAAVPATDWLFSLQRFGIEPGLERVRGLLDALARPEQRFDAVLVTGTNGKGATTAALAAMLDQAGGPVGRFTSPHLARPGERIVIAGRERSEAEFERLAAVVRPHAERLGATFFETLTAMACLAFAEAGCRTAVFEVGMGGRLDATNVLRPRACIITNVALDHTAVLGGDVAAIAREKSGILRAGRSAWTAATGPAREVIVNEAHRIGADIHVLNEDDTGDGSAGDADALLTTRSHGWDGIEALVRGVGEPLRLRSPLLGRHQGANLALAALAAREAGVPDEVIRHVASRFVWPGRLEPLRAAAAGFDGVRLLLDGAHNPAAAAVLAGALADLNLRPQLVFGSSEDKDVAGVLALLAPAVASVRLTRARTSPRALLPARLADLARAAGASLAGSYEQPTEAVRAAAAEAVREGSAVLIAGSLYLVGELRPWLLGEELPERERWQ